MKNQLLLIISIILISCSEKTKPIQKGIKFSKIVDLSHDYSSETLYWVTAKEFKLDTVFEGQTDKGYYYTANNFETAEHGGTHIDAPIHFAKNALTVDQLPLEKLIGTGVKISIIKKVKNNPDYLISTDDFLNWEKEEGIRIPDGSIVLLETGYSQFYPDAKKYLGTKNRGEAAVKELHFPGLDPDAAEWLVENRSIDAIGLDTPSIDYGQSTYFRSHVVLLSENIPAFENLTNLNKLPSKGFTVVALPMKIKGGSGAPLRIVALLD